MSPKPALYTCLSPALLHLYDLTQSTVVIIDVLRATSTIAAALHNGAQAVIPVASVPRCIELGQQLNGITAGERDGKVAEGLQYGNSPFEYPPSFINDRILVLTTTNGTKLLHMALDNGADEIITGSFPNLSAVCAHLAARGKPVILGCAAWKDRVNMEDTLFAGAVIDQIGEHFSINCDSSRFALNLYRLGRADLFEFMKNNEASHYHRLMGYGLEQDIRYCLTPDQANVLPLFVGDRLIRH
jgi:2-phosphosulfolactate phosphatase